MKKEYKAHIIWAIVAVIALGGGFFWGKSTVAATPRSAFAGFGGASSSTFARRGGAGATGGGVAIGQILSVSGSSITLQLANGNSEVVLYSASTPVTEPTSVPANTLAAGTNVMVIGTPNSDGSVTATSIQVRPAGSGSGFGGGGTGAVPSNTGQ